MSGVPVDAMTAATWADHGDQIDAAVRALGSSRRRSTILSVYGDADDSLVAEVIRTTFGPVVVTYRNGYVRAVAPLTDDRAQTYAVDGYQPLTAALLHDRITNRAKRLTLLLPTETNQARLIIGHQPDADAETAARSQVSRLKAAVAYRREQGHDAAQIAGTEEYLAAAEANLAAIHRHWSGRKRR